MKSLTLFNDEVSLTDLDDIRLFLEQAVKLLGGTSDDAGDIVLAVNEAVTNVILHGYGKEKGEVVVSVESDRGDLIVRLLDRARPFDPTTVPPPDINLPLEERPLGGLGIHMMRQLCHELHYQSRPDGGNELIFIKRGVLLPEAKRSS
jgi:serine/threonine-protein kinase RsbW